MAEMISTVQVQGAEIFAEYLNYWTEKIEVKNVQCIVQTVAPSVDLIPYSSTPPLLQ
jgi:hypothetical protein